MNQVLNHRTVRTVIMKVCFLLALITCNAGTLMAQEFQFKPDPFVERLNATAIVNYGDVLHIEHDWWQEMKTNSSWNTLYKFKSISNTLRVGINHDILTINNNYSYRVDLQVKGYNNPASPASFTLSNMSIVLQYDKDSLSRYKDLTVYKIDGQFHAMDVSITGIYINGTTTPVNVASLVKNFYIEPQISVQRYVLTPQAIFINSDASTVPTKNQLRVSWRQYNPATQTFPCSYMPSSDDYKPVKYELEWTYVDGYKLDNYATGASSYKFNPSVFEFTYNFKNNSTRIQTYDNSYNIPIVYEYGVLVFRIRTVRPDPDNYGKLIYSPWNMSESGVLNQNTYTGPNVCLSKSLYFITSPHDGDDFNWQYSINFAEEGKSKHIVNYFDGAGHGRQTQTKINTDIDYVVAADKIYDYEGRPSIQTLPIPVQSQDLNYKPDLTLNKATALPYTAFDFDKGCGTDSIAPLHENALASKYYSPANNDMVGMQQFVPDAKGYPFMETRFSSDNTNKIIWKGGAGIDFQRWRKHGTNMSYVRADQHELNRLMGSEAGWKQYYPKEVVTDPNKQSSFSIFNPSGKVVATALVGKSPDSTMYPIRQLDNIAKEQTVSMNLFADLAQDISPGLRVAEHSFFSESLGENQLRYGIRIPPYFANCGNKYIHLQGYYKYQLVSECGELAASQSNSVGITEINSSPNPQVYSAPTVTAELNPDKYTLTKELYFPDTTIRRLASYFTDDNTGIEKCYVYQDSFIRRVVDAENFPCEPADTLGSCEQRRAQMKAELYPGAKYGKYNTTPNGVFRYGLSNSIFSFVSSMGTPLVGEVTYSCLYLLHTCVNYNSLDSAQNSPCLNQYPAAATCTSIRTDSIWTSSTLFPCNLDPGSWYSGPYNCDNNGIEIKYRYQWECLSLPMVSIRDEHNNMLTVSASTLTPIQLIENFNDDIAEALLPLHPEYCKLTFCDDGFERQLNSIDNYEEAAILGLDDLESIIQQDPLFTGFTPAGPLTQDQLAHFEIDGSSLLLPPNHNLLRRIDTFSLQQAYCGCNSPEAYMYCTNTQFYNEINSLTLDPKVRDIYFEKLRGNYLANRNLWKQRQFDAPSNCGPCDSLRLYLVQPPIFPPVFSGNSNNLVNVDSPSWFNSIMQDGINGSQFNNQMPQQILETYNLGQNNSCRTQVAKIMNDLTSCGFDNYDSLMIAGEFMDLYCTTGQNGANITPDNVMDVLNNNNINISELCSPFLVEYGLYDQYRNQDRSRFVPRKESFYTGLSNFLNRTEVKDALTTASPSGGTSYPSFLLDVSNNEFEREIYFAVNSASSVNLRAYTKTVVNGAFTYTYPVIVFQAGSYTDTLYFARRALNMAPTGCSNTTNTPVVFQGASYSDISFTNVASIFDDVNTISINNGLIAGNLVYAQLNGYAASIPSCDPYAIWSRNIDMLKERDPESLDNCVNCLQIKEAVEEYYSDVPNYSMPQYTNHPLYPKAISNFLNFKLKKGHTYEEYERLIKGCALSDHIPFNKSKGQFELGFTNQNAADNFINAFNSNVEDVNVSNFSFKRSSDGLILLWIDFNSIPKPKLKKAYNFVNNNSSLYTYIYPTEPFDPGLYLDVFVRDAGCTAPIPWSTIAPSASITPIAVELKIAGTTSYVPYTYYHVTTPGSVSETSVADVISSVKNYFKDTNIACHASYFLESREIMRSADYSNPIKQQYLGYVYGLQGLHQDEVSELLAPPMLRENPGITEFAEAGLLTYQDTWCANKKEDLYFYSQPSSSHPGFTKLSVVLNQVKATLSNALFQNTPSMTVPVGALGSGGTSLKAFKMSDGGAWFRLFDQENKLYNTYLFPSSKMVGQSSDYTMSSVGDVIEIVPGAESIYRFKVKMQKTVGGNIHTVYCEGYTDYPIGSGEMIQNVVLFDHQNNQVCVDTVNCERQVLLNAVQQGKLLHGRYIDSIKQNHFLAMRRHFPTNTTDSLWLSTHKQQYQYTLYYYDLAGNLVRTVPPAGVDTLSPSVIPYVDEHRTNGGLGYKPNHTKVSIYQYNGLDQLVMQWTPDADTTKFFYDKSSRVVFSQNAKQKGQSKYSYTLYDLQGRISETGAIGFLPSDYVIFGVQQDHPALVKIAEAVEHSFIADQVRSKPREDVVATFYDNALINLGTNAGLTAQENLRKRVSSILYAPQLAMQQSSESYYAYASHFSYDAMGNVSTLTQDNPYMDYLGQRFKRIDYDYDLLSGKVNMVSYNRGRPDQFYQKYEYDADNRLETAMSSKDGLIWDRDASYRYYKHGPLAQMDLGELKVQSVQYAYTIQGWLKAINGDILRPEDDMGEDGLNGGLYPKDVFAHSLDYHLGDYKQIGNRRATYTDSINPLSRSLFNGNIARQTTGMHTIDNLQRTYTYDQLHRLKQGDYASVSNDLYRTVTSMAAAYKNAYSYDMDGNIKTLLRKNAANTDIDNLTYHYPDPLKNKLGYVADAAANTGGIDLPTGQISNNYQYDEIGNLVSDQQGQLENISWNLYGKVEQVETGTDNLLIHYDYDGAGNRVRKDVFVREGSDTIRRSDVYVRDASGNILAVYKGVSKVNDVLTIEWLNAHIQTQHGAWQTPNNTGLSPFLNAQFAHNGQFSTGLVQAAINISSVWSNNQSSSLTLGQYLQLSDGIYAQALNESIGDYYAPMVSADPAIMMATFSSNGDNSAFRNIFRSLAEDSRQSFPTIMHLSKYTPDISIAILEYIGLPSSGLSDVDRANQISGYALSGGTPLVWEGFLESAKNFSADEFYRNLASDPNIINKSWLLSNPGLADELRNNINVYAPRDASSEFFKGYLETFNPNWLKDHSSLDERLHVVYQNDRDGFMVSYLNNIGVASVNTVLSNIPQLSVYGYLQQINIGVLTGTLNPTYNPPQVNTPNPSNIAADTLFLSEHHLYGSSRLGIKTYDKEDYRVVYIGDDGVSLAHISDSSLNIRRPWLSGGFQDWIKHDRVSPYSGSVFNLSLDTFREVRNLGSKQYELTDHLGNVLATVMDRKSGYGAVSGLYTGFYANLASVSDYYPGGFGMSERTKEFENYSFGHNTQMKTDEVYGKGNLYTAKFWEMDTRISRRWNLDPVDQINISNYAVNGLNPVQMNDPLGDSPGEGDEKQPKDQPSRAAVGAYKLMSLFGNIGRGLSPPWTESGERFQLSKQPKNVDELVTDAKAGIDMMLLLSAPFGQLNNLPSTGKIANKVDDVAIMENRMPLVSVGFASRIAAAKGGLNVAGKGSSTILRHYTNESGYKSIMQSGELLPSFGVKNARYGSGQYFTDLTSGYTSGQVSRRIFGVPWNTKKLTHFIDIDATGLNVIKNAPNNYLVPNTSNLPVSGRLINHGTSFFKPKS